MVPKKSKRVKKIKKIKIKRVTKEERINTLKEHAKAFQFEYKTNVIDLVKNADECAYITQSTCWRPDIFLNNDRTCNNCVLHVNCACPSKRLAKTKRCSKEIDT